MASFDREFIPVNMAVLTVSDSRSLAEDKSGDLLEKRLLAAGHVLHGRDLVKDDVYQIRATVSQWVAEPACQVIILTGGTGVTGRDGTPEAVSVLFDKTLEGVGELFRALSFKQIGTSTIQSRAVAGVANGTFIFSLPGSSGACALGWDEVIQPQMDFRTRPCNFVELMPRLLES
ncbi:MAG: molybdenum cofactor biosynthesis protein B [Saprospiraceae bacterium]|jgi:molybdenum cofactor biosynthesis protein B